MRTSRILYPAETGHKDWARILRWLDGFAFGAILLGVGGVFWGAEASGNPAANAFVRLAVLGMMFLAGAFGLLISISKFGWRGWAMLLPLGLVGWLGVAGEDLWSLFGFWGDFFFRGGGQILKFGLYALAGVTGLGLFARLIEKVGVASFFVTLVITTGIFLWAVG
ncbi:MAG: hypothetical protein HUU38_18530 [Anaerolineales bacterium]|nr:hypothetical protein [Anaerolineales bacterium]